MRFILCLILLATCLPALAQGVTATPDLRRMQRGGVDIAALFNERFTDTLAALEADFPADSRRLRDELEVIDRMAGPRPVLMALAFKRLTELKRRYAARLKFAPGKVQAAMLGHLAGFYDRVFKEEGTEVCGRFAQDGTAVLFELGLAEKYGEMIDLQSLAFVHAVVGAIERPEPSEAAKPEDWEAVMRRLIEAGAPPTFAEAIGSGDPANPDLCPALTAFLLTISLLDTPEAGRVRADFAQNLAGY